MAWSERDHRQYTVLMAMLPPNKSFSPVSPACSNRTPVWAIPEECAIAARLKNATPKLAMGTTAVERAARCPAGL